MLSINIYACKMTYQLIGIDKHAMEEYLGIQIYGQLF